MDRIIDVKVNGYYLTKNNLCAGVQHEANSNRLRITFDDGWDGYAKTVTFWDARGENPVKRTLTTDLLENAAESTRIYLVGIPGEPMEYAGMMQFVIDGYVDGKRMRSIGDRLRVKEAPWEPDAAEPTDPTPSQAEQLQAEIDRIQSTIQQAAQSAQAAALSESHAADHAQRSNEALLGAQAAQGAAESAQAAAEDAQKAAETARNGAESARSEAETSAQQADASANAAKSSENSALSYMSSAQSFANAAAYSASQAAASETASGISEKNAKSSEGNALLSEQNAKRSELIAATKAQDTGTYASSAQEDAATAEASALLSQSYAVGGTGSRDGENIDNAKYYASVAKDASGGDFVTPTEVEKVVYDTIERVGAADIDCGYFVNAEALADHETDASAHSNMNVDGCVSATNTSAESLDEHESDENAHSNLNIDGNMTTT